jgi:LysR family transcriptional regulator (chromosome initiation inhibitor)
VLILRRLPCRATPAGQRLLRSVQQMQLMETETLGEFAANDSANRAASTMAIAVNADSLASWLLPALAELHAQHGMLFDIRTEDQDHSADLLRDGSVLGAITADNRPVQGCAVKKLGVMRYLPIASPAFVEKYFSDGLNAAALGRAPVLIFNRRDALQTRFMRSVSRARLAPPIHYVPSSTAFVEAAALGLGWAMAPAAMLAAPLASGVVQTLAPERWLDVPMYWQHWTIRSPALNLLTEALLRAATTGLQISRDTKQRH